MRRVRSSSELAIVDNCGPSPSIDAFSPDRERGAAQYRFCVLDRVDARGAQDLSASLPRPPVGGDEAGIVESVRSILADVRERGDAAVRDCTLRFDRVQIDELAVPDEERKRALDAVRLDVRDALETAAANVADFARAELAPAGE